MAVVENRFVCDLSKPVQAQALKGNVFSLDNLGSRLSVLIYDNGQPATISGSVTANCILSDGSTVNVNGGLTTENGGSKAYVDIPQSCLLIPGILKIAIKCTSSSVITTLAAIVANVYMTKTDNVITPSQQIINDWNAEISAAIATQNAAIANQDTKINDLKSAIDYPYIATMSEVGVKKFFRASPGDHIHVYPLNGGVMTPVGMGFDSINGTQAQYMGLQDRREREYTLGSIGEIYYVHITSGTAQDIVVVNETLKAKYQTKQYKSIWEASFSKNIYLNTGDAITNRTIDSDGNPTNASANGWITPFIPVPYGETIHVVSLRDKFKVAGYDSANTFVKYFVSNSNDFVNPDADTSFVIDSNVVSIRIALTNTNGYSAELYKKALKVYYYNEDSEVIHNQENLANSFEWAMCTLGTGIQKSTGTIGTHSLIKAEKPLHIKLNNSDYNGALYVYRTNDATQTPAIAQGFTTTIREFIVPEGLYGWIGLRLADDTQEYPIEDMTSILSIEEMQSDGETFGYGFAAITNGYVIGGGKANSRIGFNGHRFAEKDILVHCNVKDAVYSLVYCPGSNSYDSNNWQAFSSQTRDIVIPKGSYYSVNYQNAKGDISLIELNDQVFPLGVDNYALTLINRLGMLAERVGALESGTSVPSYYEQHIESKADTINELDVNDALQFVFITDTHVNYYHNALHSRSLITYLCKNTNIDFVVDGGDVWNGGDGTLPLYECLNLLRQGTEYTTPDYPAQRFVVIGNHDTGTDYIDGTKYQGIVPVDTYAEVSNLHINDPKIVIDEKSPTQYYFDIPSKNIRMVILSIEMRDESSGEGYGDSARFYAKAIKTAPNGYSIIIITHGIWGENGVIPEYRQSFLESVDAYNSRSTYSLAGISFNFSGSAGKIVAVISGHVHKDMSTTTADGVPVVATTTDNSGGELGSIDRTIGTVNEQAFDVFTCNLTTRKLNATRIGAGSDREFNIPSFT